ncbi:DUF1127 domain-containing protein [Salaquimonas pukyongi]|uniref:DUF1127 domain-containing protein n=1 Tax=Salaquimonas pukyongi TaxID=2712698 RepID=UPI0009FA2EBB|nr:DUF1127 domain-containing protein [Salaquimonas pukyongi]
MTIQRVSFLPADYETGYMTGDRSVLSRRIAGWAMWFQGRIAKRRSRRALARLDGRLLADVGITPEARQRELSRSFWD